MAGPIKTLLTARKTGGRTVDSRDLVDEYLAKEFSRRQLLQGALAAAALAGCSSGTSATTPARDAGTSGDAPPTDTGPVVQDAGTPPATHLVGIGQDADMPTAADRAASQMGGFDFVQSGQRVFLKVNSNSGDPYPYSTSPDMVRWVVGKVRERGAEVFVGDRSFWGDRNTMAHLTRNGVKDVCDELGVDLVAFGDTASGDATSVDWMDLPTTGDLVGARSAVWSGTMRIPAMVAQADHVIALPVVKTHFIATFTMGMKIMIGLINPMDRSRSANLGNHDGSVHGRLFKQVAYMNKSLPTVSLVVLDGHQALLTGGPTVSDRPPNAPASWAPITGEPHVVILSRDRVAADATGVALLRQLAPTYELVVRDTSVWSNRQMSVALTSGLGITGPEMYDLGGDVSIMHRDGHTLDTAAFLAAVTATA